MVATGEIAVTLAFNVTLGRAAAVIVAIVPTLIFGMSVSLTIRLALNLLVSAMTIAVAPFFIALLCVMLMVVMAPSKGAVI
jgi:hypothetical protein